MHHLALVRIHRLEFVRLAGLADLRDGVSALAAELLELAGALALDVDTYL